MLNGLPIPTRLLATLGLLTILATSVASPAAGAAAFDRGWTATPQLALLLGPRAPITGGSQGTVTVCLTDPSPTDGTPVRLTSYAPSALTLPASVIVPAGRVCQPVTAAAATVKRDTLVVVTASLRTRVAVAFALVRRSQTPPPSTPTPATATPLPPTATPPPPTTTPVPPTATPELPTASPVPPTATASATSTPVPTATVPPPTATAMPEPPTATSTATATTTPTTTPIPTATIPPATATPIPTATAVPPTATALPPTATTVPSPLSPGCADLNLPTYDGSWSIDGTAPRPFNAGETITIAAAPPAGGPVAALLLETGEGSLIATTPFPGTLRFTFATAITADFVWSTDTGARVTWTVSCASR